VRISKNETKRGAQDRGVRLSVSDHDIAQLAALARCARSLAALAHCARSLAALAHCAALAALVAALAALAVGETNRRQITKRADTIFGRTMASEMPIGGRLPRGQIPSSVAQWQAKCQ